MALQDHPPNKHSLITPIDLLNPPPTILARTQLRELIERRLRLLLLVLRLPPTNPVIVLLARLPLVPGHPVPQTLLVAARGAAHKIFVREIDVDLPAAAAGCKTPGEVREVGEDVVRGEAVVLREGVGGGGALDFGVREGRGALGAGEGAVAFVG